MFWLKKLATAGLAVAAVGGFTAGVMLPAGPAVADPPAEKNPVVDIRQRELAAALAETEKTAAALRNQIQVRQEELKPLDERIRTICRAMERAAPPPANRPALAEEIEALRTEMLAQATKLNDEAAKLSTKDHPYVSGVAWFIQLDADYLRHVAASTAARPTRVRVRLADRPKDGRAREPRFRMDVATADDASDSYYLHTLADLHRDLNRLYSLGGDRPPQLTLEGIGQENWEGPLARRAVVLVCRKAGFARATVGDTEVDLAAPLKD